MPLFTTKRRVSRRRGRVAPASRRRAASSESILLNPRRRSHRRARRNYWPNNAAGHRSAARKGWKKHRVRLSLVKDRSGRRRNPSRSYRRKRRAVSRYGSIRRNPIRHSRRNPIRSYRKRISHRRTRRNPLPSLRSFTNRSTLMTAATIGIGVVAGYLLLPAISALFPIPKDAAKPMDTWQYQIQNGTGSGKYRGLIHVVAGILLSSTMKQKRIKEIGIVIAGMGVYDLIALNITQLGLPALMGTNTTVFKPALSGSYTAGRMYGALGPSVVGGGYSRNALGPSVAGGTPSYGQSSYGMDGSYESPAARAFGNDLDLDSM